MQKRALIAVGSNIDPETHVANALQACRRHFAKVIPSPFAWTEPLNDRTEQNKYLNGVFLVYTEEDANQVRAFLKAVESAEERERVPGDPYASRTLDLDLVAMEGCDGPEANLPDPELVERDFILIPAAKLWPDYVWPNTGQELQEIAEVVRGRVTST